MLSVQVPRLNLVSVQVYFHHVEKNLFLVCSSNLEKESRVIEEKSAVCENIINLVWLLLQSAIS